MKPTHFPRLFLIHMNQKLHQDCRAQSPTNGLQVANIIRTVKAPRTLLAWWGFFTLAEGVVWGSAQERDLLFGWETALRPTRAEPRSMSLLHRTLNLGKSNVCMGTYICVTFAWSEVSLCRLCRTVSETADSALSLALSSRLSDCHPAFCCLSVCLSCPLLEPHRLSLGTSLMQGLPGFFGPWLYNAEHCRAPISSYNFNTITTMW